MLSPSRNWWMRKTIELLYAFSPSKRLNAFKDTLLVNRISTIDFINLLNLDRLLLARNNVQQRTIKILNESIYMQPDRGCLYGNDNYTRSQLISRAEELDMSELTNQIPSMNTSRLVSLIHAVTGEIPIISNTSHIQVSPSRFPHETDTVPHTTAPTATTSETASIPVAAPKPTSKSKADIAQR